MSNFISLWVSGLSPDYGGPWFDESWEFEFPQRPLGDGTAHPLGATFEDACRFNWAEKGYGVNASGDVSLIYYESNAGEISYPRDPVLSSWTVTGADGDPERVPSTGPGADLTNEPHAEMDAIGTVYSGTISAGDCWKQQPDPSNPSELVWELRPVSFRVKVEAEFSLYTNVLHDAVTADTETLIGGYAVWPTVRIRVSLEEIADGDWSGVRAEFSEDPAGFTMARSWDTLWYGLDYEDGTDDKKIVTATGARVDPGTASGAMRIRRMGIPSEFFDESTLGIDAIEIKGMRYHAPRAAL